MKPDHLIFSFSSTERFREALEQLSKAIPADADHHDISMSFIPPGPKSAANPLGFEGYVGVNWNKS